VLLVRDSIVVLETKTGSVDAAARSQVEEYARLLYYFHKGTANRRVFPLVLGSSVHGMEAFVAELTKGAVSIKDWVSVARETSWQHLPDELLHIQRISGPVQLNASDWDESAYFPVPDILAAAIALRTGLNIREIAHSEASEIEIESLRQTVQNYADRARAEQRHAICFLTGVPGSGKTLVGLSLAHSAENRSNPIHFMSGNGPLVKVLQHLFTKQSRADGATASEARINATTLIENVHVFARHYTDEDRTAPSNHAVIFDEAQRAWNRQQHMKKFKRDYSEPEMLIRIMERHDDWALVIALVGGGQEINDGEAGLEEWGRALLSAQKRWQIYASPEVLRGGDSTAGHRLFEDQTHDDLVQTDDSLHLRTSKRSLRSDKLAAWVNYVIDGDAEKASSLNVTKKFPISLSRDLSTVRAELQHQCRGLSRFGLVGSSGALRLRSAGLEPSSSFHAAYPWEHWYLGGASDVRSSFRCEVFATEFEIQGLELDWIGVCWGGDFVRVSTDEWAIRRLQNGEKPKWSPIKNSERRTYRRNAYRVLLTRAREGMVIFVPRGDSTEPTNRPEEFDRTANFLKACGVVEL